MRPRNAQRRERKNLLISEFSVYVRVFFSKSFPFKLLTVNARAFLIPLLIVFCSIRSNLPTVMFVLFKKL